MASRSPAALVEDVMVRLLNKILRRRGWIPSIAPHRGYGGPDFVRVLARVLLTDPETGPIRSEGSARAAHRRGWRSFLTAEVADAAVTLQVGDATHGVRTDRSGHIDVRVPNPGLTPGWHDVTLTVDSRPDSTISVPVRVVGADQRFGVISDIDDTVLSTSVPRPLLALYNTLVLHGRARKPVPGMSGLLDWLLEEHPEAPTIYVSTGAWNFASMLDEFIDRAGYPRGPLLLTDWGPTNTGWFRSGTDHKRRAVRTLMSDFPDIRWVLVGDDGQHDPSLYAEAAREHPGRVRAIAIRQVGMAGDHHRPGPDAGGHPPGELPTSVPEVRAPDGTALRAQLHQLGLPDRHLGG